jgi:hypothetical protein
MESKLRQSMKRTRGQTIGGNSPARGNSVTKRKNVKYSRLPEEREFDEDQKV